MILYFYILYNTIAADVVSVAVPFATGGGAIVKVASRADDVVDLGRTVDKALDVADTAADIGKAADRIDDVNDSSRAVKNICERACFIAGTLIETENGGIPIEEITAGMLVYAHNPDTGETELKEVVQTFVRETSELVHIKVNGEEIITTPTHPFWVPQKGWTDAIQLRAGDRLQLLNGEYVIIEQVQHEILEAPVTVYNFEVEDFHTYYVGDTSVLVHNKCTPSNSKNYSPDKIADKYDITVEQYHKQVKPEILKQAPPKINIVGKNPNIMLNKAGEIGYQGANGRGFQDTGLIMGDILKKLGLR